METLLVATDFSSASHNALVYAAGLAGSLHAKVVLVHTYMPVAYAIDIPVLVTDEELKEDIEKRLLHEVQSVSSQAKVSIEFLTKVGTPAEAIIDAAKDVNARWIIAGMKGSGQTMRRILGSTAISLSRKTNILLIVVPENAGFTTPKTIALASDIDDETDVHILDPLEELGIKCNSTMYVVRVIKKGMNEVVERLSRPSRVKWYCKELHPSFEFLNDNDVAHAMNEFVKEHHVDMVGMIAHEHNIFERIFAKSDIKEMMFHTHVPLVILPGKVSSDYSLEKNKSADKSRV